MVPGEGFVDLALIAMKGSTGCGEAANFVRQRHDCGDRVKYKQSKLFVRRDFLGIFGRKDYLVLIFWRCDCFNDYEGLLLFLFLIDEMC